MRRVRYSVAMTLDGYVAGPKGEIDWIVFVDTVEVAIIPVLLGGGRRLLPDPADRAMLKLTRHRVYPKTGTVASENELAFIDVVGPAAVGPGDTTLA